MKWPFLGRRKNTPPSPDLNAAATSPPTAESIEKAISDALDMEVEKKPTYRESLINYIKGRLPHEENQDIASEILQNAIQEAANHFSENPDQWRRVLHKGKDLAPADAAHSIAPYITARIDKLPSAIPDSIENRVALVKHYLDPNGPDYTRMKNRVKIEFDTIAGITIDDGNVQSIVDAAIREFVTGDSIESWPEKQRRLFKGNEKNVAMLINNSLGWKITEEIKKAAPAEAPKKGKRHSNIAPDTPDTIIDHLNAVAVSTKDRVALVKHYLNSTALEYKELKDIVQTKLSKKADKTLFNYETERIVDAAIEKYVTDEAAEKWQAKQSRLWSGNEKSVAASIEINFLPGVIEEEIKKAAFEKAQQKGGYQR